MKWICPFCQHAQIVSAVQQHVHTFGLSIGENRHGNVGAMITAISCANNDCGEVTLGAIFGKGNQKIQAGRSSFYILTTEMQSWTLRPSNSSKPQPEYIPQPIREDYMEACAIRDLSPKASATLSRRCLQGMIRDFCGVSKRQLVDEISELRRQVDAGTGPKGVDPETLGAIDAVRSIGNIGAHMERDINVIIDVDEGEAQALIGLLELLFADWYVARHNRRARLASIEAIAAAKKAEIAQQKLEAAEEGADQPDVNNSGSVPTTP